MREVKTIYNPYENDFEKLHFDIFNVELTRRCNLSCEHCLRGEAQDINITSEIIDKAFEQIQGISGQVNRQRSFRLQPWRQRLV